MTEGKRRWSRIQDGGIMRAESGQCTGAAAKMEEEGLGNMGTGSQTADGAVWGCTAEPYMTQLGHSFMILIWHWHCSHLK